ncbi:MAG: flagellar hook-associated protein 1 FlgK [Cognaticolwellia sp.]
MGILSTLSSARSGLNAASVALDAASNNVSNASTEGYSRRSVRLQSSDPIQVGSNWRGTGVSVAGVDRAQDVFVTRQLVASTGNQAEAESEYEVLFLSESWFNDVEIDGLPTMLQGIYDSLTQATQDPSDETLRREVANSSLTFATSVSRTAESLVDLQAQVQDRMSGELTEANQRIQNIADLNRAVIASQGNAADLLDQRDIQISALAEQIGVDFHLEEDGSATILLGGHTLVNGVEGRTLSVEHQAGESSFYLSLDDGRTGVSGELGGALGGMATALSRIEGYLGDLDLFVQELSTQFNDQHALGFDSSGAAGVDWFQTTGGSAHLAESFTFNQTLLDDPSLLAFAADASAAAGDGENLRVMLEMESGDAFSGTMSGEETLLNLLSEVGGDTASARRVSEQQGVVLNDLQGLRDAISGVDLDEEAANLIEFQASYQAAAKVLRVSSELFDTLMDAVR